MDEPCNISLPKSEYDAVMAEPELFEKYKLSKDVLSFFEYPLADSCMDKVKYLFTLGGDGTILWAHKIFCRQHVP